MSRLAMALLLVACGGTAAPGEAVRLSPPTPSARSDTDPLPRHGQTQPLKNLASDWL